MIIAAYAGVGKTTFCEQNSQNALPGAAFCKGKLCSGNKPQPQCGLALNHSAFLVHTKPCVHWS